MPDVTTIVFLAGLALTTLSAIGGGFEIKEMKFGSLSATSRVFCALSGLIFMAIPVWHPEFIKNTVAERQPSGKRSSDASASSARPLMEPSASRPLGASSASSTTVSEMSRIVQVVEDFFSQDRPTRLAAQQSFHDNWGTNPAAVEVLVDRCNSDIGNVRSVYNALSIINRGIPPLSPNPSLSGKILQLARNASGNSDDTSRVALESQRKLR